LLIKNLLANIKPIEADEKIPNAKQIAQNFTQTNLISPLLSTYFFNLKLTHHP
jgi:hypothetical protein